MNERSIGKGIMSGSQQTAEDLARIIGRQRVDCPAVRRALEECARGHGWVLVEAVPPIEARRRYACGEYPAEAKAVTLAKSKFGYAGLVGVFCPSARLF